MNRLQLAHLPLRTKLIAASALTASLALLTAAITQGVSSYFYSHNEAYEHLDAVAHVVVGRSSAAIQSQDFGQAEALVSALRVEPMSKKPCWWIRTSACSCTTPAARPC